VRREGWQVLATAHNAVWVRDLRVPSTGVWLVHDNGGEWGVERVNDETTTRVDIPTHWHKIRLDAGTMGWRVLMALRQRSIDCSYRCPELIDV
jgi:hypothetical protein